MRVVSWNLKNIGQGKLGVMFGNAQVRGAVGNTVLDYIARVVLGLAPWNALVGGPADLFVMIEVKTGGSAKNTQVSDTCVQLMTAVVAAVNAARPAAIQATYHYDYITPLISGRHETVGIIYNDVVYDDMNVNAEALRDDQNHYINPRTPLLGILTNRDNDTALNVIGIHAPPPSGAANRFFQPPINYCRRLPMVTALQQAASMAPETALVMGDFNCDQASAYAGAAGNVMGFTELTGMYQYQTGLMNNTLTSVRRKIVNGIPAPGNYLSGAYDNIFSYFEMRPMGIAQTALDLIGQAPAALTLQVAFNAYASVSDHIPVMMTW